MEWRITIDAEASLSGFEKTNPGVREGRSSLGGWSGAWCVLPRVLLLVLKNEAICLDVLALDGVESSIDEDQCPRF